MDEQIIVGIQGWGRKGIPPQKKINNFFIKSLIQLNLLENPAITNLHKSFKRKWKNFFKKNEEELQDNQVKVSEG